jgi:hypothetical protein
MKQRPTARTITETMKMKEKIPGRSRGFFMASMNAIILRFRGGWILVKCHEKPFTAGMIYVAGFCFAISFQSISGWW